MTKRTWPVRGRWLLLLAAFLFVLAGCGTGGKGTSDTGSPQASTPSGGEAAKGEVKIGLNLELSGNVSSYGTSAANGAELAAEELNKQGGIDGMTIKLVKQDNRSDNAESANVAVRLMTQDQVSAIIGAATSGNTKAMIQLSTENKVPVVSPTATAASVTVDEKTGQVHPYMFRACFIDPFQGKVAAQFALNDLKAKTAAVYIDSSSDYSKGLAASFIDTFKAAGGTIVAEESYVQKDTDFRSTLTRIKDKNPDVLYVPGYYEEVGLIIKQARELGYTGPIVGGDGWDSPTLLELAGKEALNNTFFTNHYSSEDPDPAVQAFVKAYKDKFGKTPDGFAALGYDAMYLLADAIKRAGSSDPEKIAQALAETKDLQLVTGKISIDENHNPVKAAAIIEFKDGKQTFRTKVQPE
ncbi:ABC transporter substrate-binding protein [Hydrogenibacillus schlegelii]|uniref:ABC transporter substrate-binding protein n=1 Tax=Hydrogenibacillus schlegelii TaxID=1484 RepID=UPI0009EBA218|nr:ABC transporter substrate-binding protein [Hydrogenibacillus schlegelii]